MRPLVFSLIYTQGKFLILVIVNRNDKVLKNSSAARFVLLSYLAIKLWQKDTKVV